MRIGNVVWQIIGLASDCICRISEYSFFFPDEEFVRPFI